MRRSPCLNCEKCGCGAYHDKCELYQEFKKELEKEYDQRKFAKDQKNIIYDQVYKNRRRKINGKKK